MDNQTKLKAIQEWQDNDLVHPLACQKNSNHRTLVAEEREGKIILKCLDCNYVQDWVPDTVYDLYKIGYHEKIRKQINTLGKKI